MNSFAEYFFRGATQLNCGSVDPVRARSRNSGCRAILLFAVGAWLSIGSVLAANVVPEQEYGKYIDKHSATQGLSSAPFGEQISLRDGGLAFRVVDIELPGIGPDIQIVRTFRVNEAAKTSESTGNHLGDWELEIPRIKTITAAALGARGNSPYGWQVPGSNKNARCNNFAAPGPISFWDAARHWESGEWWSGYQLVDGSGGVQELLKVIGTYSEVAGSKAITKGNWKFSCLPSTANGEPGDAFLAIDPDGNKYWFNYLVYTQADALTKKLWSGAVPLRSAKKTAGVVAMSSAGQDDLPRRYAALLMTRVEDRFGNWVNYQYTGGLLTRIFASDSREVNLARNGATITISVNTGASQRSWQYTISGAQPQQNIRGTLSQVSLPDGSSWHYNLLPLSTAGALWDSLMSQNICEKQDVAISRTIQGTITSPSGLSGVFTLTGRGFGRSYVPQECWGGDPGEPGTGYALLPAGWAAYAITSRSISGPGIHSQTWAYSYSASHASWSNECSSGCVAEVWTDVLSPIGVRQRSIFSNRYDETENQLLREEIYGVNGEVMRQIIYGYASLNSTNTWPWPSALGDDLQTRSNWQRNTRWVPLRSTTIHQGGTTFNSFVNSYDRFSNPASVRRWSSLGYDRTEVTEYYDHLGSWVLGQVKKVTNANTGIVMSRTEYNATTALPYQGYAYEKLQQTLGYHANGTLHTSTDGGNNTTTFTNWKRCVPQNIQYADGTTQSASVDDNGWIRAVVDENGFSTGYGYDAMGRLGGISYPSGDTVTYHNKGIGYRALTAADWRPPGVEPGQWRRYETEGNRVHLTYYDALWRPVLVHYYDASNVGPTLQSTKMEYDAEGRVTFQSYPTGEMVPTAGGIRTTYDALGRVTQVKQDSELGVLTTTTEYLPNFEVRTTNPRGLQTHNGYQVFDTPSYDNLAWSVQPEGKTIQIDRNFFGLPVALNQRNPDGTKSVTRRYVYDGYMQLCKTIEPETGVTVSNYDAAGNLEWSAAGLSGGDYNNINDCVNSRNAAYGSGRRISRSYDARNRITFMAMPDGRGSQSWGYTPDGLVASSTVDNDGPSQASVNQVYLYNKRRLLISEAMTQPGWYTWTLGYGYDANANPSTLRYPNGLIVGSNPNALGQATSVVSTTGKVYASNVSYYPNGAVSQFTYGNGIVHTMQQNARQLPVRSTDSGIINFSFGYDPNGNPTVIYDDQRGEHYNRWMAYDGLDRLTDAGSVSFGGDHWHRIRYDALDNITSNKLSGVKDYANYVYDANNRLTQIQNSAGSAVVNLSYDVQGNLAGKNGQGYQFDYGNRLRTVTAQESYRYDAEGRRVLQWSPAGGNILSIYSKGGQLMFMEDQRRGQSLAYIYLAGSQIARAKY